MRDRWKAFFRFSGITKAANNIYLNVMNLKAGANAGMHKDTVKCLLNVVSRCQTIMYSKWFSH